MGCSASLRCWLALAPGSHKENRLNLGPAQNAIVNLHFIDQTVIALGTRGTFWGVRTLALSYEEMGDVDKPPADGLRTPPSDLRRNPLAIHVQTHLTCDGVRGDSNVLPLAKLYNGNRRANFCSDLCRLQWRAQESSIVYEQADALTY